MKNIIKNTVFITLLYLSNAAYTQKLSSHFIHIDTVKYFTTISFNSVDGKITREEYANDLQYGVDEDMTRIIYPDGKIDTLTEDLFNSPEYNFYKPELYFSESSNIVRLDLKDYTKEVVLERPQYVYFNRLLNDHFLCTKINGGEFEHDGKDGGTLYYEQMTMEMFLLDKQGNSRLLLDVDASNLPINKDADIDYAMHVPYSDKILLVMSIAESGGRWGHQYFLVNIEDGSFTEFTKFDEFIKDPNSGYLADEFLDVTGKYIFVPAKEVSILGETTSSTILLFDSDFNFIQECLPRQMRITGYNYENDTAVSINLKSHLDVKRTKWDRNYIDAIIAYRLTVDLEKTLYQVYHNQELNAWELKDLDEVQLNILKNMVFAKHNYAFDSEFYQAFFNLFDFYNTEEKRKARTKDINNKLSYNDSQNLEKIKQALSKLEYQRKYGKP